MSKWAIRAVFVDDNNEPKSFTYYDEQLFNTEEEAFAFINSNAGEEIVQACEIDNETEEDLQGLTFDDLEPIEVKNLPYKVV